MLVLAPPSADVAGERSEKEQPTGSQTELAAQKTQNEDSREEGINTLEEGEPRLRNADPGEKENREEAESNEIRGTQDAHSDEALDNRISKDFNEDEQQQREDEEEQPNHPKDSSELDDEGDRTSRQGQEQSKEAAGERVEREDDGGEDAAEEDPTEAERLLDLAEEDEENEETQGDDSTYHKQLH